MNFKDNNSEQQNDKRIDMNGMQSFYSQGASNLNINSGIKSSTQHTKSGLPMKFQTQLNQYEYSTTTSTNQLIMSQQHKSSTPMKDIMLNSVFSSQQRKYLHQPSFAKAINVVYHQNREVKLDFDCALNQDFITIDTLSEFY